MTAKERRQMRKLEIRLEESERMLKHISEMQADQFITIYEDHCAMLEAQELMSEAWDLIHSRTKNDPQYMVKKKEIEANF